MVKYPFSTPDTITSGSVAATQTVNLTKNFVYLKFTTALSANKALTVTADSDVPILGGQLFIEVTCDGTARTISYPTSGSLMSAADTVLTASKTSLIQFVCDGSVYRKVSEILQN